MTQKKYEITNSTRRFHSPDTDSLQVAHQIRALIDIPEKRVKKGQPGGYITSEYNLSHYDTAWIERGTLVSHNARVEGDATVENGHLFGHTLVTDNAYIDGPVWLRDDTIVEGNARILGRISTKGNPRIGGDCQIHAGARISGNPTLEGDCIVEGRSEISDNAYLGGQAHIIDTRLTGSAKVTHDFHVFTSQVRLGERVFDVFMCKTDGEPQFHFPQWDGNTLREFEAFVKSGDWGKRYSYPMTAQTRALSQAELEHLVGACRARVAYWDSLES